MTSERALAWLEASLRHRLWFAETDEHDGASLPFTLIHRDDLVEDDGWAHDPGEWARRPA